MREWEREKEGGKERERERERMRGYYLSESSIKQVMH